MKRTTLFIISLLLTVLTATAQHITGVIVDEVTGDSIPLASVQYKGHKLSWVSDQSGRFTIERRNGWYATFSAVGYQPLKVLIDSNTPQEMRITLKVDTKSLGEVTIKAKKLKYSRKENPAV